MSVDHAVANASVESEWDFLLAASSADPEKTGLVRVRTLLGEQLNWEAVLRLANDHGTTSLLYKTCLEFRDVVPPPVMAVLRERYEKNVQKSLFLARELIRILDCMDALGVEAIPYKGVVLAEAYHGDMAMRQSGDMDIFVRKSEVERIRNAVRDLGYEPHAVIAEAAWPNYIASGYECTFDSSAGKNLLELQWALQPRFYAVDFDMDVLFERAVGVSVAGRRMKTPSPEDLLLVLSIHAAKHVWERLIWLCDIARIARRENLNWEWVQAQARGLGIERILHITLLLTNRCLGMPIPGPIERALLADRDAGILTEQIAATFARGGSYQELQPSYFRLMMRLRERRIDRLRFLARLIFTPGPGEWDAVRLPKTLFPLYPLVRLARLAGRLARR